MADAEIEKTTATITVSNRSEAFSATGEVIQFDGFLKVYIESRDDDSTGDSSDILPAMTQGEELKANSITATERYTQHPPRYTEASLVKKMEELGIGRPSTYAPTISTIQQREYVEKGDRQGTERQFITLTLSCGKINETTKTETVGSDKGKLIPTDTGIVVNDFLTKYFPNVLDYNFTANVEQRFDEIAEGNTGWHSEINGFYNVFHPEVTKASDMRLEHKVGERTLGTDPVSGRRVSVKIGRFGPVVQIGDSSDEEKPQFASLAKDQSVFDITLEQALKLFDLPRTLGEYEGKDVVVGVGRFGPYVRHDGKFVSIPKDIQPTSISLEEAEELINAKRQAEAQKVVKIFDEDPDMQILNGRYGVYIAYKKSNFKIPRTVENPAELTLEQCMEIVNSQAGKTKRTTRKKK